MTGSFPSYSAGAVHGQDTSYPSAGEGDGDLDQRMTRVEDTLDELIGGYASDLGEA